MYRYIFYDSKDIIHILCYTYISVLVHYINSTLHTIYIYIYNYIQLYTVIYIYIHIECERYSVSYHRPVIAEAIQDWNVVQATLRQVSMKLSEPWDRDGYEKRNSQRDLLQQNPAINPAKSSTKSSNISWIC